MTVIAFTFEAPDGDAHFFEEAPDSIFCSDCGSCVDRSFLPARLKPRRKSYEVSCTYDNRMIVSNRFREFCLQHDIEGAEFTPVNGIGSFYLLESNRQVKFDWERRKTRFENLCAVCGRYESIVGAYPAFLKDINQPLLHGFYCSDLEFGSGREKTPILFVGTETKKLIEEAHFKRPEFEEVIL